MPSVDSQVASVRRAGGLFTDFPRRFLVVRGPDRVKFLHNIVSHDIRGLQTGQGKPACLPSRQACILDRQGKIQASFLAHAFPDEIILEMEPIDYEPALHNLKKYLISEAVNFADTGADLRVLALHGPASEQALRSLRPNLSLPAENLRHAEGPAGSGIRQVIRWDLFGMPGYHLWVSASDAEALRKELEQKTASADFPLCGREVFHTLRIEAGVPWPGIEITPAVILNELGTDEMVSFTKGCYIGQEIVARIKYRAHPPRLLKKFRIQGAEVPETPCPLLQTQKPGQAEKPVGTLTSVCWSPTFQSVIGLGFLNYGTEETEPFVVSLSNHGSSFDKLRTNVSILP